MTLRVLVVDDHDEGRRTLQELLRLWGHEVRDEPDGRRALDAASTFRPHVAIVDLDLPGAFDADRVAEVLRAATEAPMLIAYASAADARERMRATSAGFDYCVVKPGGLSELQILLAMAETRTLRRVNAQVDRSAP